MATKQVNIDIIAKDKTRQALRGVTQGIDRVKNSVFNLRNALLGVGAGFVAKGFLNTAREVERLQVRFKFLFSEVSEGEKAFKNLVKFAGEVPFTLEEIQRGSANLAVVSKNAEELNTLLKITGDVASASGLDFATTAEQIQRTFSSGINSADLFRERGVKALLGFEAGVKISAEKSKKHIIDGFKEGTLSVVGASSEMAKTFDGTMSMISDKYTRFQMAVMDSAPFDFLKKSFMLLEKELEKNFGGIEKAGAKFGKVLAQGFKDLLIGSAKVLDFIEPMFKFVRKSITNLIDLVQSIPSPFDSIGVIGFLMLGRKGKGLILLIGGFLDEIKSSIGFIMEKMVRFQIFMNKFKIESWAQSKEDIENTKKELEKLLATSIKMQKSSKDLVDDFDSIGITGTNSFNMIAQSQDVQFEKMGRFEKMVHKMLKNIEKQSVKTANAVKNAMTGASGTEMGLKGQDILTGNMGGSELLENTNLRINEKQIQGLHQMADMEVEIAKQTAEKTKEIAHKTALDQKNLRQTFINEQSAIMKSGQFQDLKMTGLTEQQKKDMIITGGRQILNSMSQNNKKAFQINKALNMADAFMNTATGVTKALASANIPMAFLIGAMGAVQIATIAQQKYQGRKLGGRMNQGQPYMVGEAGPELVVPDRPSNVVPNNKLGNQQPVNVNFNINTVDARGFNE